MWWKGGGWGEKQVWCRSYLIFVKNCTQPNFWANNFKHYYCEHFFSKVNNGTSAANANNNNPHSSSTDYRDWGCGEYLSLFFRVSYLSGIFNSNFTWCPEKLGCSDIGLIGDWPWEDLWVNDNSTSPHNYHRGYCELLTSELNTYSMDLNTW